MLKSKLNKNNFKGETHNAFNKTISLPLISINTAIRCLVVCIILSLSVPLLLSGNIANAATTKKLELFYEDRYKVLCDFPKDQLVMYKGEKYNVYIYNICDETKLNKKLKITGDSISIKDYTYYYKITAKKIGVSKFTMIVKKKNGTIYKNSFKVKVIKKPVIKEVQVDEARQNMINKMMEKNKNCNFKIAFTDSIDYDTIDIGKNTVYLSTKKDHVNIDDEKYTSIDARVKVAFLEYTDKYARLITKKDIKKLVEMFNSMEKCKTKFKWYKGDGGSYGFYDYKMEIRENDDDEYYSYIIEDF